MELKTKSEELTEYADLLKAIAHPVRLCIVKDLLKMDPTMCRICIHVLRWLSQQFPSILQN